MSLIYQCDGCRGRIPGAPALTLLGAGGERLDFCGAETCGRAAWQGALEATKPARLTAIRRAAQNVSLRDRIPGRKSAKTKA